MKILIVNQHIKLVTGGSELQCHFIAEKLASEGYEVLYGVVADRDVDLTGIKVKYQCERYNTKNPYKLLKEFKREGGEILYWRHNRKGLFLTFLLCLFLRIKIYYAASSIDDANPLMAISNKKNNKTLKSRIKTIAQSLLTYSIYPFFNGVILLNSDLLSTARNKNKIVIRNSIELKVDKVNRNISRPYVLWAGSIKQVKNPEVYLEIAQLAVKKIPNIKFVMVGSIVEEKYVKEIKNGDLIKNFEYLGAVTPEQVNYLLSESLCLIHTCEPEGFGNVFIQAWSLGIPTITTHFDPENLIYREKVGFSKVKSASEVIEKITECINPEVRKELSENAKQLTEREFSIDKNISKLKGFLNI